MDELIKLTQNNSQPAVSFALKLTEGFGFTAIFFEIESEHPKFECTHNAAV